MMSGYDVEGGRLVEFFEFRHLTFQEFLTARAMVEGWHTGREEADTLVSVLEPHFGKEEWREVIPLAAVLGGKATEALIQRLAQLVKDLDARPSVNRDNPLFLALGNCLADDAAARPETIRVAVRELVRLGAALELRPFTPLLARGRYGTDLREEAGKALTSATDDLHNPGNALVEAVWWQTIETEDSVGFERAITRFEELLQHSERIAQLEGALGLVNACFLLQDGSRRKERDACAQSLRRGGEALLPLLFAGEAPEQYASCFALEWLAACRVWTPPAQPNVLGRLFELWRCSPLLQVRDAGANALARQPLALRGAEAWCTSTAQLDEILQGYEQHNPMEKVVALVVAWHVRALDDAELTRRARELLGRLGPSAGPTLEELLKQLEE